MRVTTSLNILDVAIGLMVVYLVLSLLCSSVNEAIETFVKNRSRQLERGIRELLEDPDGTKVTHLLYNHPLITGLFQGQYDPSHLREQSIVKGKFYGRTNLPSYIPATNFALAMLDIILPSSSSYQGGVSGTLFPGPQSQGSATALRQAAANFPVPAVGRALMLLIDASGDDLVRMRQGIEGWYNSTMDRVSGWYKRRTQVILFVVGISMS